MAARRAHTLTRAANPAAMAVACGAVVLAALAAPSAQAQSLGASANDFSIPYGRLPGDENRGVDPNTRDANGNRTVVNGRILLGEESSTLPRSLGTGVGSGFAGSTAIGNQLNVIVNGSRNTVIVDATQINNGDVNADVATNGDTDDDG